ncbi:YktB family protein [Ectobacillus polymachus]|uniref:YktB family protein n=1 Tax=Ectobacillus polymachus TaxID=1508806 RepID=UPI003A896577
MKQIAFDTQDFSAFSVQGLDERMEEIKKYVRPKLEQLGETFQSFFTKELNEPFFYHVAKHARRTVNPPSDTWVAFAPSKRGYKMLPHFQIGLWGTHMFVYFGLIYECPQKAEYARALLSHLEEIKRMPKHFVWSTDHTKPNAIPGSTLNDEQLTTIFRKLETVKKAELLTGIHISKEEAIKMSDYEFMEIIQNSFSTLLPLYTLTSTR